MSERIRYVGLDVSKATIQVAVAETDGTVVEYGSMANDPGAVRRLVKTLGKEAKLVSAYEAGPTGYPLHRQLVALGVENMVIAPSLMPKRSGDRVKTDRRDAIQLARLLRSGDLTRCGSQTRRRSRCETWCGHATTLGWTTFGPDTG